MHYSHNFKHYYFFVVTKILNEFIHVLKDGEFEYFGVPEVHEVIRAVIESNFDIEDGCMNHSLGRSES